jgi:hypothetical protein
MSNYYVSPEIYKSIEYREYTAKGDLALALDFNNKELKMQALKELKEIERIKKQNH